MKRKILSLRVFAAAVVLVLLFPIAAFAWSAPKGDERAQLTETVARLTWSEILLSYFPGGEGTVNDDYITDIAMACFTKEVYASALAVKEDGEKLTEVIGDAYRDFLDTLPDSEDFEPESVDQITVLTWSFNDLLKMPDIPSDLCSVLTEDDGSPIAEGFRKSTKKIPADDGLSFSLAKFFDAYLKEKNASSFLFASRLSNEDLSRSQLEKIFSNAIRSDLGDFADFVLNLSETYPELASLSDLFTEKNIHKIAKNCTSAVVDSNTTVFTLSMLDIILIVIIGLEAVAIVVYIVLIRNKNKRIRSKS